LYVVAYLLFWCKTSKFGMPRSPIDIILVLFEGGIWFQMMLQNMAESLLFFFLHGWALSLEAIGSYCVDIR
jgi:hypothetical protein